MSLMEMQTIPVHHLGQTMCYRRYIRYAELLRTGRRENLVFCQHKPVITTGVQTQPGSLLLSREAMKERGVELVSVKRGGDATAHEPGQIVIYPHIDLRRRRISLSAFVRSMLDITEEALSTMFGLPLQQRPGAPGLYTEDGAKVVSSGLEIRSGFSSSGVAVNYSNSLHTFSYIHPCGHAGLQMQTVLSLLGEERQKWNDLTVDEKKREFCQIWAERFIQSFSLYS